MTTHDASCHCEPFSEPSEEKARQSIRPSDHTTPRLLRRFASRNDSPEPPQSPFGKGGFRGILNSGDTPHSEADHSRGSGNPDVWWVSCFVHVMAMELERPARVIPAQAGIQRRWMVGFVRLRRTPPTLLARMHDDVRGGIRNWCGAWSCGVWSSGWMEGEGSGSGAIKMGCLVMANDH